jgi:hypothetical protein
MLLNGEMKVNCKAQGLYLRISCTNRTIRTVSYTSYKFWGDSYSFAQSRTISYSFAQFRTAKVLWAKICVFLWFFGAKRGVFCVVLQKP